MRRMYACLGVIGLTILTICVVMLVRTNSKDLVYELPGAKSDGLTILEYGSELLWRDATYAWHVSSATGFTNILSFATLSDESDYKFAVSAMLDLLPKSKPLPKSGEVYRSGFGKRYSVYYVPNNETQTLFVLMLYM